MWRSGIFKLTSTVTSTAHNTALVRASARPIFRRQRPGANTSLRLRAFSSSADAAASTPPTPPKKGVSLFSWGTDHEGSLLLPEYKNKKQDIPTEVQDWKGLLGLADSHENTIAIQSISCGATDTAILLTDGRCYVCGKNANGQLGLGHKEAVPTPTLLNSSASGIRVQSISMGENFSSFIDHAGNLYTFGFGGSAFSGLGLLGHGDGISYLEPTLVHSLIEDNCYAQEVQVSDAHLTVLTTEGEVLTCGAGSYGRLGNFDTTDQLYLEPTELLTSGVTSISGGKEFTMALKGDEGIIYGWGRNHKGQVGTGLGLAVDMYAMESVPAPIESDQLFGQKVVHVSAGSGHAACITEMNNATKQGQLFYWGMGLYLEPHLMTELFTKSVVDVQCGLDYTMVRTSDGSLFSFGKGGSRGVLGHGTEHTNLHQPEKLQFFEDYDVKSVIVGCNQVFAFAEEKEA